MERNIREIVTKDKLIEFIRFGIVGCIAIAIQYTIYLLLMDSIGETLANTVGYIISFCCNFMLTTYFTFHVKPNKRKAGGFAFSHLINWAVQTGLLNFFLWIGLSSTLAPWPMYAISAPINFLFVRFFVKVHG